MTTQAKVVIVEDDHLLQQVYCEAFTREGYAIETYSNGEDAFNEISKSAEKPAVIMSDITMPKMSGLELLKKLKESEKLRVIPVVLTSNLDQMDDAKKGLELGAVAYVTKTDYSLKELVERVREIVSIWSASHASEETHT